MKEFFTNPLVWSIALFFVLNLINVVLGTMRSILTVKSTPFVSMVINTVSYTFYSGIVKLVSGQDMIVVLVTTALTNIIGVYIARFILDKAKKDKLWRITATIPENIDSGEITNPLKERGIQSVVYIGEGVKLVDIYSKTQGESIVIKEILAPLKVKYSVVEIDKKLYRISAERRIFFYFIALILYCAKVPAPPAICTKIMASICATLHIDFSFCV